MVGRAFHARCCAFPISFLPISVLQDAAATAFHTLSPLPFRRLVAFYAKVHCFVRMVRFAAPHVNLRWPRMAMQRAGHLEEAKGWMKANEEAHSNSKQIDHTNKQLHTSLRREMERAKQASKTLFCEPHLARNDPPGFLFCLFYMYEKVTLRLFRSHYIFNACRECEISEFRDVSVSGLGNLRLQRTLRYTPPETAAGPSPRRPGGVPY